ncbi:MAG: preprotein translocase subunit SecG [Caldithrix sp.]|nr:preprotein translocase subunit SecG [Caldithrix sp.]
MYTFLIVLFVLLSIIMVVVILMQAGKGKGLAGAIGGGAGGGGGALFGGRGAADFLSKSTAWIAAAYMVLALFLGVIYKSNTEQARQSLIQERMEEQQQAPAPNLPVAPIENQQQQPGEQQ